MNGAIRDGDTITVAERISRNRSIGGVNSLPLEVRSTITDRSGRFFGQSTDGMDKFLSGIRNGIRQTFEAKTGAWVGPNGPATKQTDDEFYLPPVSPTKATANPRFITPLGEKFIGGGGVRRDIPSVFIPTKGGA